MAPPRGYPPGGPWGHHRDILLEGTTGTGYHRKEARKKKEGRERKEGRKENLIEIQRISKESKGKSIANVWKKIEIKGNQLKRWISGGARALFYKAHTYLFLHMFPIVYIP